MLAALALLAFAAFVIARPGATTSIAPRMQTPTAAGLGGALAAERTGASLAQRPAPGQPRATSVSRSKPAGARRGAQRHEPPAAAPGPQALPIALAPAFPVSISTPVPAAVDPRPQPVRDSDLDSEPVLVPQPLPGPTREMPPPEAPPPPPLLDASFESGLRGWNTAGVGEVVPWLALDIVREGGSSAAVRLVGDQDRSELILGGDGGGSTAGIVRFYEGDEYFYAFSFYIQSMVYGAPGAHNLIMQFKSNDAGSPNFGLQLWDYAGDGGEGGGRGLWSHGAAMGGDRFLAPTAERAWHDVIIHFKASSQGAGFYEVFLDGRSIDARQGVSMIVPGVGHAYIKDGLYRNGYEIPGTSEIRLDAVRLGKTLPSVRP